jgi:hypothetical protein
MGDPAVVDARPLASEASTTSTHLPPDRSRLPRAVPMRIPNRSEQIALEAARLLFSGRAATFATARLRATRRLAGATAPNDLPSHHAIRRALGTLRRQGGLGDVEQIRLRLIAVSPLMLALERFSPRLVGKVLRQPLNPRSVTQLVTFADEPDEVLRVCQRVGLVGNLPTAEQRPNAAGAELASWRVYAQYPVRVRVYPSRMANAAVRHPHSRRRLHDANLCEVLARAAEASDHAQVDWTPMDEPPPPASSAARFAFYQSLLAPLALVQRSAAAHPERDVLYHSLQVFELARAARAYDEEFLLAALLHDVGLAIDPRNAVETCLATLGESVTPRTAWLIRHLPDIEALRGGRLGVRAERRLRASPDFDDLDCLSACDRNGRQIGRRVLELDEALDFVLRLAAENEE